MMKRFLVLLSLMVLVVFTACGGGGGGSGSDGSGSGGSGDSGTSESITSDQAQDILYAAYAGIGYMKPDDASDNARLYNAMFYDLNQLAGLMIGKAVYFDSNATAKIFSLMSKGTQTFKNDLTSTDNDSDDVAVTLAVTSGGLQSSTKTITITDSDGNVQYNSNGTPQTEDQTVKWVNLVCDLTVNFISTAYAPTGINGNVIGTTTYTGGQGTDLTVHANIDLILTNPVSVIGHEFSITTSNSLMAASSDKPTYTIQYKPWNIAYSFNEGNTLLNMHILPIDYLMEAIGYSYDMSGIADYQLYTLTGTFKLNDTTYDFSNGMKYGQLQIDQGTSYDGRYIALDGMINDVDVYSLGAEVLDGDISALVTKLINNKASLADVIKRDDNGLWQSGTLTLTGDKNHADVSFAIDGTVSVATIALSDGGTSTVSDWMNLLDPLN